MRSGATKIGEEWKEEGSGEEEEEEEEEETSFPVVFFLSG